MKMQKLALIAGLVAGIAQCVQANLIVNGGFETGDLTGWTYVGGSAGVSASYGYSPHSGNYFFYFGNVRSDGILMSQNIADSAGTTYDLTWWIAGNGTGPSDANVYWNGTLVSRLGSPIPNQPYTEYSVAVTGTGSDVLKFGLRNDPNFDALDDVSLNPTVAGVPDGGATVALLGMALAGLFAARRKFAVAA